MFFLLMTHKISKHVGFYILNFKYELYIDILHIWLVIITWLLLYIHGAWDSIVVKALRY